MYNFEYTFNLFISGGVHYIGRIVTVALADPGGGGRTRPHPQLHHNGRGPMLFLCPKRLISTVI